MMPLRAVTAASFHWGRSTGRRPTWQERSANSSGTPCVVERDPLVIFAARHAGEPRVIVEVPAHRLAHPALERFLGTPPELPAQLRRVDGVAAVVTRTVLHERHEARVIASRGELR